MSQRSEVAITDKRSEIIITITERSFSQTRGYRSSKLRGHHYRSQRSPVTTGQRSSSQVTDVIIRSHRGQVLSFHVTKARGHHHRAEVIIEKPERSQQRSQVVITKQRSEITIPDQSHYKLQRSLQRLQVIITGQSSEVTITSYRGRRPSSLARGQRSP